MLSVLELLGLPAQASTHAAELDNMLALVHWLMLVLFVGWGAFFAYTLVTFRRSANPVASYSGTKGQFSSYVEVSVAVAEAILLVGFAVPAWAVRVNEFPPEQESVIVRVVAEQFEWTAHYPGEDGRFGATSLDLISPTNPLGLDRRDPDARDDIFTINQLNLPVGRPVIIHLSSKDVIHSFAIAEARVKQDTIPGMSIPVWFTPSVEGNFEINCSQLCGLGHYRMRGFVNFLSPEDYEAWLADEAARLAAD